MHNHANEFYINGQWVKPLGSETIDVFDPATEEVIGTIAAGTSADVDAAVSAAKAAFVTFSKTRVAERKQLLERCYTEYKERIEDIAQAVSAELGAPIDFARSDQTGAGTWHLGGFIKAMDALNWDGEIANGDRIIREPIGVVGCITPWNWPLNQIALKVFAAIAAGCTVVLKPSEITPYNAMIFAEILDAAGVPAGVFNMVHGLGPEVGSAMSKHADIDMMSFTGSTRAGAFVTADSAPTVKRVALELGGKSPNVIFADCDVEERVRAGVSHCMDNVGQSCNAPSRMLVERSVYDKAVEIATNEAENTRVMNPTESEYGIGPLVSGPHFEKVQGLIQTAIDEGCNFVAGGVGRPEGFNRGYFTRPTVIADIEPHHTLWYEEVFGPVLVMAPFDDIDHAIELANDTPYGLAAYVQTGSPETAETMAQNLRAGMVRINGSGLAQGSPFGGYKQSGNGREGGVHGIEDFLETKLVTRPKGFMN